MKPSKVLLTGFKAKGKDFSTSKILLERINDTYDKYLFSNDLTLIKEEMPLLFNKNYDYIIMFGWKPVVKDMHVEIESHSKLDTLFTNFPLNKLLTVLKANNVRYKISENPGNSYCNFAYYNVLNHIYKNKLSTKVIFIHIPHLSNFKDMDKIINILNQNRG